MTPRVRAPVFGISTSLSAPAEALKPGFMLGQCGDGPLDIDPEVPQRVVDLLVGYHLR